LTWARLLGDIDPAAEPDKARSVGSFYQALLSGVAIQWLIDPQRAPSATDLVSALRTICAGIDAE
jgi:hypothetical protein